jgi:hypothetical protein
MRRVAGDSVPALMMAGREIFASVRAFAVAHSQMHASSRTGLKA